MSQKGIRRRRSVRLRPCDARHLGRRLGKALIGTGFNRVYLTEPCPKASQLIGTDPFMGVSIVPKMVESILE